MFSLYANKNQLTVLQSEQLTSGSVNVYKAQFEFSPDWEGLTRTAVFKAADKSVSMLLDDSNQCSIPWEVLTEPYWQIWAGVYGTKDANMVLPTVWVSLSTVLEGTAPGEDARPPIPSLWQQELAKKGDTLDYDGLNLSLKSGDRTLSAVEMAGCGEGVPYRFGHGFKQEGLTVSVDAVNDFSGDNTLPMTAAGVQTTVGNIEALLATM